MRHLVRDLPLIAHFRLIKPCEQICHLRQAAIALGFAPCCSGFPASRFVPGVVDPELVESFQAFSRIRKTADAKFAPPRPLWGFGGPFRFHFHFLSISISISIFHFRLCTAKRRKPRVAYAWMARRNGGI